MDVRNYGLVVELRRSRDRRRACLHAERRFLSLRCAQRRLLGRRTNRRFSVGDEIRVFVARVDTFKRQIDFAIADQGAKNARDGVNRSRGGSRQSRSRPAFFRKICFPFDANRPKLRGFLQTWIISSKRGSCRSSCKHFHVEFRENDRGKFLRITEEAHGRRNTIIVPSTGWMSLPRRSTAIRPRRARLARTEGRVTALNLQAPRLPNCPAALTPQPAELVPAVSPIRNTSWQQSGNR